MSLHVAADAEGLAASRVRALERLLSRVRVAVDSEAAGAAEGLVACLADVAILALRERAAMRRVHVVVVVLPRVAADGRGHSRLDSQRWRERLRKRSLVVEAGNLRLNVCACVVGAHGRLANVGSRWEGLLLRVWRRGRSSGHGVVPGIVLQRRCGLVVIARRTRSVGELTDRFARRGAAIKRSICAHRW
jgi:hypothetical protein